jgi:RHS repeat-associated protein
MGSPIAPLDAAHRAFDSFGNVTQEVNPTNADILFGFTGRPFDPVADLQNNLNRWYDPSVGRWISEDPIGFAGGDANLARYVGNTPNSNVDPFGLETLPEYGYENFKRVKIAEAEFVPSEVIQLQNGPGTDFSYPLGGITPLGNADLDLVVTQLTEVVSPPKHFGKTGCVFKVKTLTVPLRIQIANRLTFNGENLKLHPHTVARTTAHEGIHLKAYQTIIDDLAKFLNDSGSHAQIPEEKVESVPQPMALAFLIEIWGFEEKRQAMLHIDHWGENVVIGFRKSQGHWRHMNDPKTTYGELAKPDIIAAVFPDLFPNGIKNRNAARDTIDAKRDSMWSEFKVRFKAELR